MVVDEPVDVPIAPLRSMGRIGIGIEDAAGHWGPPFYCASGMLSDVPLSLTLPHTQPTAVPASGSSGVGYCLLSRILLQGTI